MDEDEFEDYDREVELALYREYRDVVSQFRYVVETERRFYLANEVEQVVREMGNDFYFEITMNDVWVWDVYRSDRFVKSVRVLTFKDVNVEELSSKELELPKELALDE
jgi:predicted Rdx family selenoprotein